MSKAADNNTPTSDRQNSKAGGVVSMEAGMTLLELRFETLVELTCALKIISDNVCEMLDDGDDEAEAASALRGLVRAVVKEAGAMAQEAKIIRRGPQVAQPAPAVMQ